MVSSPFPKSGWMTRWFGALDAGELVILDTPLLWHMLMARVQSGDAWHIRLMD